ncbi:hypothetical protein LOTGIDRAFT_211297 [Lottia gigantea]|uniref:H/ACA ribonucleoprotein complex subunit 2 n=1 Tax=Lottia gigantea TaxID=225164 RepID=V3YX42_LOTGI|nr:hypothetical protein LOTGIDRAFT_211297 [Lottia gigantea]ESO82633.1 hypothetical protein LOTGIDRAFT_211297 [Lottia gigantea]
MGKNKKEKRMSEADDNEVTYEEKMENIMAIANPIASKKLTKRIYKTVKKASSQKKQVIRGIKQIQKFIKKGTKGFVVIAGDVHPIDAVSHLPILCEDAEVPYCYIPSKQDLGRSLGSQYCVVVMVQSHEDYEELYDETISEIKSLPLPF